MRVPATPCLDLNDLKEINVKKLVDLSHSVENGMTTYPGVSPPIICDYLSREASKSLYADGVSFCIHQISMPANTGTYIDSPFHRYADGNDIAQIPLRSVANLEIVTCRPPQKHRAIGVENFEGLDVTGKAVLVETGWSRHWGTEKYNHGHPFLTFEAAIYLKENKAVLVGIDSLNIDDTDDPNRPVHSILLGSDIPIVEHMCNLSEIPDTGAIFHAAPVKIHEFGTFPVRAYAVIEV